VAIMGIDCASGDTFAATPKFCVLESMFIAEPVIKMAINPVSQVSFQKASPLNCPRRRSLSRF